MSTPGHGLAVWIGIACLIAPGVAAEDCNDDGIDDVRGSERILTAARPVAHRSAGLTPRVIVALDFDLDGDIDLAAANRHSNSVSRLLNHGDGGWEELPRLDVVNPAWMAAGDFDGNGRLDLATVSTLSPSGTVLFNGRDGFDAGMTFALGATGHSFIASGHLDADPMLDLVTLDRFQGRIVVYRGSREGGFSAPEPLDLPSPPVDVDLVDVDGDADLDLAAIAPDAGVGQLLLVTQDAGRLLPGARAIALPFTPLYLAGGDLGLCASRVEETSSSSSSSRFAHG